MKRIIFVLTSIFVASCGGAKDAPSDDDRQQNILATETQDVQVVRAEMQPFCREIVSNGKISADRYADVYWNVEGTIEKISANRIFRLSGNLTFVAIKKLLIIHMHRLTIFGEP